MELKHNWNKSLSSGAYSFNRTAYGIETFMNRILLAQNSMLLIAPLMELKLISTYKAVCCIIYF